MPPGIRQPRDTHRLHVDVAPIVALVDLIKQRFNPSQIRLFGSRARGNARPLSDWDLLVVVPNDCREVDDPMAAWRVGVESGVCCDLILCRESDFQEDSTTPNTLAFEAAHDGVLIYER